MSSSTIADVWIIDCEDTRRSQLQAVITDAVRSRDIHVNVRAAVKFQDVTLGDVPTLAFWHVGDRQNQAEQGFLGRQVNTCAKRPSFWIAGFTGGLIARQLQAALPEEAETFRVKRDADGSDVSNEFAKIVRDTVTQWISTDGAFGPHGLQRAWLGVDPLLEAKLDFLATRLEGRAPVAASLETLKARYPDLDLSEAAVPPRDHVALTSVRDAFFHR